MDLSFIDVLLPILLSGGLVTALVTLYRARHTVPVERDSVIVQGATGAVTALERALQAETARADRNAEEIQTLAAKIDMMQETINTLQAALDEMKRSLSTVQER